MEKQLITCVCAHGLHRSKRFTEELLRKHPEIKSSFDVFFRGLEVPVHIEGVYMGKVLTLAELRKSTLLLVHQAILSDIREKLGASFSEFLHGKNRLHSFDFPRHEDSKGNMPVATAHHFSELIHSFVDKPNIGRISSEEHLNAVKMCSEVPINRFLHLPKKTPPGFPKMHPCYDGKEGD